MKEFVKCFFRGIFVLCTTKAGNGLNHWSLEPCFGYARGSSGSFGTLRGHLGAQRGARGNSDNVFIELEGACDWHASATSNEAPEVVMKVIDGSLIFLWCVVLKPLKLDLVKMSLSNELLIILHLCFIRKKCRWPVSRNSCDLKSVC